MVENFFEIFFRIVHRGIIRTFQNKVQVRTLRPVSYILLILGRETDDWTRDGGNGRVEESGVQKGK